MAVAYDFRILNMSDAVEQFKQIALGCVERQVTDVQTRRSNFNRSGLRAGREDGVPLRDGCFAPSLAISKKCGNPLPECLFLLLRFFSLMTRRVVATASGASARTVRASPS